MATNPDEGPSRLWRGMRALIFGDDGETTLRDQIEEAIDDAEGERPISGDLSPHERQMLRNLLHFGDRTAGEVAVPRGDIIAVPDTIAFDDLAAAFADAGHSRLPVYKGSLDHIVGMIHIKDVFVAGRDPAIDRSMERCFDPIFVTESMGVLELIARCGPNGCSGDHRRRVAHRRAGEIEDVVRNRGEIEAT